MKMLTFLDALEVEVCLKRSVLKTDVSQWVLNAVPLLAAD